MMLDALLAQLLVRRERPVSVAVTAHAVVVPGALIIFLAKPSLYHDLGLAGVLLLSLAISFPIVLLCFSLWYSMIVSATEMLVLAKGNAPAPPPDLPTIINSDDQFEWPCLLFGGWTANLILYLLAALAFIKPLRIGATFLLSSAILIVLWVLLLVALTWLKILLKRRLKREAESNAANAAFLDSLSKTLRRNS